MITWFCAHTQMCDAPSFAVQGLEVVFVSRDNDDATFKDYYATMPWTALPFSEKNARETLQKKFNISGIPTLVILDTDGQSITTDGTHPPKNPILVKPYAPFPPPGLSGPT